MGTALGAACVFTPPPPLPGEVVDPSVPRAPGATGGEAAAGAGEDEAGAPPQTFLKGAPPPLGMTLEEMHAYAAAQGDPEEGGFTMAQALLDLPGDPDEELWARFETTMGRVDCRLFAELTPTTVANFVGLARGRRPAKLPDEDAWTRRRFYDGTEFHRVIEGFMIQGGDPLGTGRGNAGYVIPDEFRSELRHDAAGKLSMANRGPGTGSSQFFITLGPTPHLDGKHTIFGECTEEGIVVAESIASVGGPGDRPRTPVVIERLEITRGRPGEGAAIAPDEEPSATGGETPPVEAPSSDPPPESDTGGAMPPEE